MLTNMLSGAVSCNPIDDVRKLRVRDNKAGLSVVDEDDLKRRMIAGLDGDRAAYHAVLQALAVAVRHYVGRRLANGPFAHDVEDVVQVVLIAVHERRETYDRSLPLTPWVYGITRYKLLEHLRANKRRTSFVTGEKFDAALEQAEAPNHDLSAKHDLARLLDLLPEAQRDVLRMTKLAGYSSGEVAQKFGISVSAVKVRVHRALHALRKLTKEAR